MHPRFWKNNIQAILSDLHFPVKKRIKLYFKNYTRDIYIEGNVELIECDLFTNKQIAQISIICPKPYFKDVQNLITTFGDVSSMFEFPFSISKTGIEISGVTTNQRRSIINTGDIETGVIIKLFSTGTVVNPVIYDVLKRTQLKLNFTMLASDTIVINRGFVFELCNALEKENKKIILNEYSLDMDQSFI